MQFTPQQLTGGPKYSHKVKIGNWSEDKELDDIKLKDYLKKKENGALFVNAKAKQLEESLIPTELNPTPDGAIHFGHRVMMLNHQSNGLLTANPFDSVVKAHEAIAITTCANPAACVRSTLIMERADLDDGFAPDDDVIHYGQTLRLKIEPFSKLEHPVYLHSEIATALTSSKYSRHQEVCAIVTPNGETLWQILFADSQSRFEMEGEPVQAGTAITLRHVQTGSFLASDEIAFPNLFGTEFEVHCHHYYSLNKTQNLTSEKKGDITGDYALRRHGLPNIWTIVTGSHGQDEVSAKVTGRTMMPSGP